MMFVSDWPTALCWVCALFIAGVTLKAIFDTWQLMDGIWIEVVMIFVLTGLFVSCASFIILKKLLG